ncbi:hypothetical protein E2C01_100204 [Portunus trituberculatus]|uniref:Uncharacterized protein n=1 Tax=Portunus trituberculatus TaxID=210409 RepID=A0A5B7K659_PORTR|nr:hypothetical protein [Portunus trituberculatus]
MTRFEGREVEETWKKVCEEGRFLAASSCYHVTSPFSSQPPPRLHRLGNSIALKQSALRAKVLVLRCALGTPLPIHACCHPAGPHCNRVSIQCLLGCWHSRQRWSEV